MPRRKPMAPRCVVIAATRDGCVAGRAAGMRVLGLCSEAPEPLDDAADVVFEELEDEWEAVTFDDLFPARADVGNAATPRRRDGFVADRRRQVAATPLRRDCFRSGPSEAGRGDAAATVDGARDGLFAQVYAR